jgi:4-diphosphocytidyl-2-C-methyl-D-erythritol kinase
VSEPRGPSSASARAPAKINPTLLVLGRRADGYHEVDTTLVALDLCDAVTVSVVPDGANRLTVDVTGPAASDDVPRDTRNLAVRALLAAREALAAARPWLAHASLALSLVKHIPSQAGLGGGSSDAAAAVHALECAVGAELAAETRRALLARLGADCVFFDAARATGAARARGVGERIEVLRAPPDWHVVVVTPEARCPTGLVYGALRFPLESPPELDSAHILALPPEAARVHLFNHLERAALAAVPELRPWRALLDDLAREEPSSGTFRLSGSGSSWFALAQDDRGAEALCARVVGRAQERALGVRAAVATRVLGPS